MPIIRSKKKHMRQTKTRTARNTKRKNTMKLAIKTAIQNPSSKNKDERQTLLSNAYKAIDKTAKQGIIKKKTAARKKARIARAFSAEK